MAKFNCTFSSTSGGSFSGENDAFKILSADDMLDILRPAALKLKEFYKETIRALFVRRTGNLEDSIDIEDDYIGDQYAFIMVKPFGTHKGSSYARRSRAGAADRKYAKHGRKSSSKKLKNEELAYLLEVGTPRIDATHWMENTNEQHGDEIQDMVESEFDAKLRQKGLID